MKLNELLQVWGKAEKAVETEERYSIRLPLDDAARVHALAELHSGVDEEQIIRDLLSSAIGELEATMPYVPGETVIREDDQGDPIYDDVGMTPRFLELVRKHKKNLHSA